MINRFVGTCVELAVEDLMGFDDSSREITQTTFRKHFSKLEYWELEERMGYGSHLRLSKDHHVRYHKGKWKGASAICMMHSAIHHIWTLKLR